MKIFLFIASGLVLFGNVASCMATIVHPDSAFDLLIRGVWFLVAAVLFCAAAIIGSIEAAALRLKPEPPDYLDGVRTRPIEYFDEQGRVHHISPAKLTGQQKAPPV